MEHAEAELPEASGGDSPESSAWAAWKLGIISHVREPRMRVWLGILIVLLCAILPGNARAEGKSYALLVGVNEYFFGQGFPNLKYCAKDAHAIHETLIDECKYDNVKLLVSKGADPPTKQAIIDALQEIMKQATDEDTVLIYFSGHGLEVDKAGLVAVAATPANEREGLLATADCDIRKPGKTGLLVSEVKRILAGESGRKSPKCKFLILDCCHAGSGGTKAGTRLPRTTSRSNWVHNIKTRKTLPTLKRRSRARGARSRSPAACRTRSRWKTRSTARGCSPITWC